MKGVLFLVGAHERNGLYESSLGDLVGVALRHNVRIALVGDSYTIECTIAGLGASDETRQAERPLAQAPINFIVTDASPDDEKAVRELGWQRWSVDAVLAELSSCDRWQVVIVGDMDGSILRTTQRASDRHDAIHITSFERHDRGLDGILDLSSSGGVARFVGEHGDEQRIAEANEFAAEARIEMLKASHVAVLTSDAIQQLSEYLG